MLVLTRRIGERIVIDNRIVLEVLQVNGQRVRLGIQAPNDVNVVRSELLPAEPETAQPGRPGLQPAHS